MTNWHEGNLRARQLAHDIVDLLIEKDEQHTGVIIGALSLVALHIVSMRGNQDFHTELKEALRSGTGLVIPKKTVCIVARRSPDPEAIGSKGDRDTDTCRGILVMEVSAQRAQSLRIPDAHSVAPHASRRHCWPPRDQPVA